MKVFKDFFNKKRRDLTVEAFDNIMDDKKEKLIEAVKERRLEVAVGGRCSNRPCYFGVSKNESLI